MTSLAFSSLAKDFICIDQLITVVRICYQVNHTCSTSLWFTCPLLFVLHKLIIIYDLSLLG